MLYTICFEILHYFSDIAFGSTQYNNPISRRQGQQKHSDSHTAGRCQTLPSQMESNCIRPFAVFMQNTPVRQGCASNGLLSPQFTNHSSFSPANTPNHSAHIYPTQTPSRGISSIYPQQTSPYRISNLGNPHIMSNPFQFNQMEQHQMVYNRIPNITGSLPAIPSILPTGNPSANMHYQVNSTQDWMMSMITHQAQQIQQLLQTQQPQNNHSLNQVPNFPGHSSANYNLSPRLSSQLSKTAFINGLNSPFPQMESQSNELHATCCQPTVQRKKIGKNSKPSATFIPGNNKTVISPKVQNTATSFSNTQIYQTPDKQMQHPSRTGYHLPMDEPKLILSLREHTDDMMDNAHDEFNSSHNDMTEENSEEKEVKGHQEEQPRVRQKNTVRRKRIFNQTKEHYKLRPHNDSVLYPIFQKRLRKIRQRQMTRNMQKDVIYKPPYRIAKMKFWPRLLPTRDRRQPLFFARTYHWDTLVLKTVIEKNSKLKSIQVIHKTEMTRSEWNDQKINCNHNRSHKLSALEHQTKVRSRPTSPDHSTYSLRKMKCNERETSKNIQRMAKKNQRMKKTTQTRSLSVKMRREQLKYGTRQIRRPILRGKKQFQDIDMSIALNILKRSNQEVPELSNTSTNESTKMRKLDRKEDEQFDMQKQLSPSKLSVHQKSKQLQVANTTDHQEVRHMSQTKDSHSSVNCTNKEHGKCMSEIQINSPFQKQLHIDKQSPPAHLKENLPQSLLGHNTDTTRHGPHYNAGGEMESNLNSQIPTGKEQRAEDSDCMVDISVDTKPTHTNIKSNSENSDDIEVFHNIEAELQSGPGNKSLDCPHQQQKSPAYDMRQSNQKCHNNQPTKRK